MLVRPSKATSVELSIKNIKKKKKKCTTKDADPGLGQSPSLGTQTLWFSGRLRKARERENMLQCKNVTT